MAMLHVMGPQYCPDCKPVWTKGAKVKRRLNGQLQVLSANYSGTGVDMVYCPDCGHGFSVSYKVASIERDEDWDRNFKAEKAYEIEQKEKYINDTKRCLVEEDEVELAAMRKRFEEEFGDQ